MRTWLYLAAGRRKHKAIVDDADTVNGGQNRIRQKIKQGINGGFNNRTQQRWPWYRKARSRRGERRPQIATVTAYSPLRPDLATRS